MMLCNYIPLVKIATIALVIFSSLVIKHKIMTILFIIYIIPPLLCRMIISLTNLNSPKSSINSKEHLLWWLTFNLQVVFNRLPILEEILRMLPSVYSMWLRLWGAKIGKLTYWSPKVMISDRSFIQIGDHVVIGAGSRLIPHYMAKNKRDETQLILSPIKIGNGVILGGYSLLGPGTIVKENVSTRAFHISKPFTIVDNDTKPEEVQ